MLISFIKKGVYGYLREDRLGIHGFVSNNNLAIRRKAALQVGGYREVLRIAEDYDVCQRVARAGWLLYFCPEISLGHRARASTRALLRQWWSYGFHLARNHARFHPGRVLLGARAPGWRDPEAAEPLRPPAAGRTDGFRPTVLVYLSAFALLHLAAIVAALAWLAGPTPLAVAASLLLMPAAVVYAFPDFRYARADGVGTCLGLCALRFLVNLAFVGAGLLAGLTRGSVYVLPPIATRLAPARGPRDPSGG